MRLWYAPRMHACLPTAHSIPPRIWPAAAPRIDLGFTPYPLNPNLSTPAQARLLVSTTQIGCILGKGGAIVSEMRKSTGARIKILGPKERPPIAGDGDELIQVSGEAPRVKAALEAITAQLRAHPPRHQPQV